MIMAMVSAMTCMYNMQKGPSQKSDGTKSTRGKPYLGEMRPTEVTKGCDGKTNPSQPMPLL